MNTPMPLRSGRLLAGLLSGLCILGSVSADEVSTPRGTLSVDSDLFRAGTRPQFRWDIQYPASIVTSMIDILPADVVMAKEDMELRVRVLGASFREAKSNNGHGNNIDGVDSSNPGQGSGGPNGSIDSSGLFDDERKAVRDVELPVELLWSKNNSSFSSIFYGYQTNVNPSTMVLNTTVKAGDTLRFGGRGKRNNLWLPIYSTGTSTNNQVMLKNGDRVPSTVPALNGSSIESFLKPYMDQNTKTVKIGERDLILLMELGGTNTTNSSFDLQDLVVLVTFE